MPRTLRNLPAFRPPVLAVALLLCAGPALAQQAVPAVPPAPPAPGDDAACGCAGSKGVALRLERALGAGRGSPAVSGPVYLRADEGAGEFEEHSRFRGGVEVRRDGTVLRADEADYEPPADRLRMQGRVRVRQGVASFEGPSLDLRLEARTGSMPDASYTYAARGGRGNSRLVEFLGDDDIRLNDATYTTCRADDPSWWIRAGRLDIHRADEVAVAHATTLYFEGVPVFASPWFELPLGDQRRSGLLTPGFYQNSRLGQEFIVPIYWSIAPNYDYTFTPDIITRRGALLGNEVRLLQPTVRGLLDLDVMPNDRTTGNVRDHVKLQGDYAPAPQVRLGLQYNRVSDDNYLIDFAHNIISASPSVLPQEALVSYGQTHWNASLQVAKSQTLSSLLASGDPGPYERVPEARWNGTWLDWHGLDLGTSMALTRFQHPAQNPLFAPGLLAAGWYTQDGSRLVAHPSASLPWLAPGWFVVPRVQWDYSYYELDPTFNSGRNRASRSLPTWSLDAGLVFERPITLLGEGAHQTLEPRLFYAFTPYRNQSQLPNFDSAVADFNFAQLFTENTFTGNDRISQADQLTIALTSRVMDDGSGAQRLRVALGQRFYFGSQLVTLPGDVPRTDPSSDVLFMGNAMLAKRWNVDLNLDYSTRARSIALATVGLRWQPGSASVANFTYRYENAAIAGALIDQVGASLQWPLSPRVYGVGAVNYSVAEHGWIESLAGIEYKAGCWVGRFVLSRYAVPQPNALLVSNYTTTWFIQVELNGLTSVGQSPLDQLQRSIPGFHRINPRQAAPSPFDFYD